MSQIKTKFIENDAVTDQKFKARNNQYVRARNAAGSADINLFKLNASDVLEFGGIPQITSGTPSAANDVATIQAVKDIAAGLRDPKDAVRVVSTANITISPGGASLVVDGVTLANGDRILLSAQSTGSQNGIYVVGGVGSSVTLTRTTDMDASAEVSYGLSTLVVEGTANAGSTWMLTTADPITLGSTSLTFSKIASGASYAGGDMIALAGSTFSIDLATTSGLESTNPGNVAGQLRVKVSGAVAVKDRTMQINASNEIDGLKAKLETFTLIAGDITNGYVDLAQIAAMDSVSLTVVGGPPMAETTDFTLNYTGGTGGKTRLTFAGDLASAGAAALATGDVLKVSYQYL